MSENALRQIIEVVCKGYVDTLLIGIEENSKDFPYTIACSNFIDSLEKRNIIVNFFNTFDDSIVDMVLREVSNYLVR